MLQYYVINRGWSNGRAAHVYKEKFGVWPRALDDTPKIPNIVVAKFVDAGIRKYIRSMKSKR
jgi:hypothetical protein